MGEFLKFFIYQFVPSFTHQAHHQGCPASLVGSTETFAGFAVEVFVEKDEILPIWIV